VPEAWVIGHQVLARLKFNGHFTGEFAGHRGGGREICFDAVDIYTIRDARIVTNWHLEDNLNAAQAARRKRSALKIRSVRGD
jgi:predicted ester cyclase